MKLLIFFDMPLLIETISLEETDVRISLMVTLAINEFETIKGKVLSA